MNMMLFVFYCFLLSNWIVSNGIYTHPDILLDSVELCWYFDYKYRILRTQKYNRYEIIYNSILFNIKSLFGYWIMIIMNHFSIWKNARLLLDFVFIIVSVFLLCPFFQYQTKIETDFIFWVKRVYHLIIAKCSEYYK